MRETARGSVLRRRMLYSVVPAVVGAVFGYLYARYALDEATFQKFVGMYGGAGAAGGILLVRMVALFKAIFGDYFRKNGE